MSKKTTNKKRAADVNEDAAPEHTPTTKEVEQEVRAEVEVGTAEPVVNHTLSATAESVKSPREKRNGVTRPRPGKCGDVLEVCDELLTDGKAISFEAIRAELPSSIADATIKTQRQRHRTFHGLGRKLA